MMTFTSFCLFVCLMVFKATFNNISVISWQSVLLVEETRGPGEKPPPPTNISLCVQMPNRKNKIWQVILEDIDSTKYTLYTEMCRK